MFARRWNDTRKWTRNVTATFAKIEDVYKDYKVKARFYEDAEEEGFLAAIEDLHVDSIVDLGDGEYDVTVSFAGIEDSEMIYTVDAPNEEKAASYALNAAQDDIDIYVDMGDDEDW